MRAEKVIILPPPVPVLPSVEEIVLHLSLDEARTLYAVTNVSTTVARAASEKLEREFPRAYNPGAGPMEGTLARIYKTFRNAGVPGVSSGDF